MHQSPSAAFQAVQSFVLPPPPEPLTGWPLTELSHLDEARPGFLRQLMIARPRRRQSIYASLAMGAMKRPQDFAPLLGDGHGWHGAVWPLILAEVLLTARPQDIAAVAFGGSYDGLLASCERAGPQPLDRASYAALRAIYADPREVRRQRVISSTARLTDRKLEALRLVPNCALHPRVLETVRTPEDAAVLKTIIDLALIHTPKGPAELWKALSDGSHFSRVEHLAEQLLRSFQSTESSPDIRAVPGARLLDTGTKLREAARDFHNCLATGKVIFGVVAGEVAFATSADPKVVVQLQNDGEGRWAVTGVYGPENHPLPASERLRACGAFRSAGFRVLASVARDDQREKLAERLRAGWFGFEVAAD